MNEALKTVKDLQNRITEAESSARRLALHFCEDVNGTSSSASRFQLQECFKLFADFFDKVDQVRLVSRKRFMLHSVFCKQ